MADWTPSLWERFERAAPLLETSSLVDTPLAAQFARWVWATEASPEEHALCSGLAPCTVGRMLLSCAFEAGGCEPDGEPARRLARARWLRQFILSRPGSRPDPLAEEGEASPLLDAPRSRRALGAACRSLEASLAPVAGSLATFLAACAFAPVGPAIVSGVGACAFGSLCLGAAAKAINRSGKNPMVGWRLRQLAQTYPDLAQQGMLGEPKPHEKISRFSPEGALLRQLLLSQGLGKTPDPARAMTWVELRQQAFVERAALEQTAAPSLPKARPRL